MEGKCEMPQEKPNGVRILRILEVSAIVFSVVTGACTTATLVWKGGAMAHAVETHEERLNKIELRGSPPISEHIKLDDERAANVKQRLEKLEAIFEAAMKMQGEVGRISQKIDDLKEQIARKP